MSRPAVRAVSAALKRSVRRCRGHLVSQPFRRPGVEAIEDRLRALRAMLIDAMRSGAIRSGSRASISLEASPQPLQPCVQTFGSFSVLQTSEEVRKAGRYRFLRNVIVLRPQPGSDLGLHRKIYGRLLHFEEGVHNGQPRALRTVPDKKAN
jgi:hypothetical protein